MKGNFQLKLTIFVLFFSFWSLKPTWGQEQCDNQIILGEVITTPVGENSASIEVSITTSGRFEATLNQVSGSGKSILATKRGEGNQHIIFENVSGAENLQVSVTFLDEGYGWCKKRQISQIQTLER